jgi:RNA polymerase sigma-70 factor (ECF subfamily)
MIREDGLKYREVAQILDISQKAVENQLAIALKKIRPNLERYVDQKTKSTYKNFLFL